MSAACPFCQIAQHEAHAHIIYETPQLSCFLDIDPINEGHILIIPKLHCANIDELPEETAIEIMRATQRISSALTRTYHAPGYSIMQNGGDFCDFGHLHFHIFPRYHGDGFGWTFGENKPDAYSESVAKSLRESLQI
jgi:Diadenosine tetraphosphate (Ap4A) hydrolase and other HIT family hydrolases